jgi:hypothetical protein
MSCGLVMRACHAAMPHGHVTRPCHAAMSHGHVTRPCHTATSYRHVTRPCHTAATMSYAAECSGTPATGGAWRPPKQTPPSPHNAPRAHRKAHCTASPRPGASARGVQWAGGGKRNRRMRWTQHTPRPSDRVNVCPVDASTNFQELPAPASSSTLTCSGPATSRSGRHTGGGGPTQSEGPVRCSA